ncbi:MAG: hypothetical protein AAGF23_02760 [Acidobacteriota bacterium]
MRRLTWGLLVLSGLAVAGLAAAGSGYAVRPFSIDGGGGRSAGGDYVLDGAIGQADAGALSGGGFRIEGGVLPGGEAGVLFCDGFESGDTSAWSAVIQ